MSRRALINNSGGVLPSQYTQLQYLSPKEVSYLSSILIDYTTNEKTVINATCAFLSYNFAVFTNRFIRTTGPQYTSWAVAIRDTGKFCGWATTSQWSGAIDFGDGAEIDVIYNINISLSEITVKKDDITIATLSGKRYISGSGLGFWGAVADAYTSIGKLYDFKVFEDGSCVLDLIPCFEKETNYAGLYDVISGSFFSKNRDLSYYYYQLA